MSEPAPGQRPDMLDGRYNVRNSRAEPPLRAVVSFHHEITEYIAREGDIVTLHDTADAGSGLGFLLRAWVSLYDGRCVDLRGVQACDDMSMAVFEVMMRAYWRPELWSTAEGTAP